ncbi:hypothetical protein VOLCADRAFT_100685 [Volvox carteri f. nagariensis]|uniref:Uncharacterized protein n=1 Tax=Volvox carteri f. nagariensis TaxID=3068 RepID=D8UKS7_VOLCA|nr:uncharacterized protein VOLCADRAFT_100685 [Volvox carteri f. nagariensis]EFJ39672.1 hypothetical protein VOLCADRAFT_100685 [Volvox carteri f. nagariensis]|eukprot:XP_002959261.1 hypothetical protein VOLCADRAFT_100685 [Volvox carteri f. nagariensis]
MYPMTNTAVTAQQRLHDTAQCTCTRYDIHAVPVSKRLRLGSLADGFRSGRTRPLADLSAPRVTEQQQPAASQRQAVPTVPAGPAEDGRQQTAATADTQLEGRHQDADPSAAEVRERWRRQKAVQRAAALPELRLLQRQQDAARHAAACAVPEVRAQQQVRAQRQQRNTAQYAAALADPEVRARRQVRAHEQQQNTAQHATARADPEVRVQQQLRDAARHAAARADPEVRALQQQRNTAQHAAARQVQQQNQQAAPRDTLLARMHRLLRFADLHHGDVIELPEFLLALPEGRVQDLPGGQLPPDRQVCSEDQSTVMHWTEIPNVDILRADVMCTDAVQRWGRTLVWRRMARTAQGDAPPPPDPVLPARYRVSRAERAGAVDEDGGSASGAGRLVDDAADGALDVDAGAQETGDPDLTTAGQQPEPEPEPQQLPPDQQPRPPRVLPRACPDDPASVEVPYCMRLEPDLPNRTMLVGDGAAEHIFVCNICHKALSAAALAFGCNQLFTLACEVDRVYTAEAAAQLARPEDERGDCALLQPAADRARDSAYYSTKYTGKSINDSQAQLTCNALTRVQDFLLAGRTPTPGASGPTAFGNMCATVHRMTAAITAGMALVAMKLDGHSTFEATFESAYLQVDAFTALSAGAEQSPEAATTAAVLVEAEEHGSLHRALCVEYVVGPALYPILCVFTTASLFLTATTCPLYNSRAASSPVTGFAR